VTLSDLAKYLILYDYKWFSIAYKRYVDVGFCYTCIVVVVVVVVVVKNSFGLLWALYDVTSFIGNKRQLLCCVGSILHLWNLCNID